MKKLKALFLSLALSLTFATALTAVGCKGCGGDGEDSSSVESVDSSIDFGAEDSPVSIKFGQGQVSVNQYETIALTTTVKGTSKALTFTSSDEAVASVDANGVVTAKDKIGSATISATVEGVTATCVINVVKSPYLPEIVFNQREYTIEDGDVLKFSVATEWNKEILDEDVTYAVTFAEDSLGAKAELGVEGNEVTVKSKGVESVEAIVSATVRGIYTSKSFTVNVVEASLRIQPTSATFTPTVGGYKTSISTTAELESDLENSVSLDFAVTKGSQTFTDATIEWTISNNTLAKITDNNVVGQKRGTVELTGTVTKDGETAEIKLFCEVVPPEVKLDETAVFDLSTLKNYVVKSALKGKITDAEFHGEKVTSSVRGSNRLMLDTTLFPKQASLLGKQQLVVNTEIARYIMDVEVYTRIIKTADDLKMMRELAYTNEWEYSIPQKKDVSSEYYDGYFVLGNDIAFNDVIESMTNTDKVKTIQNTEKDNTRGFRGIFDGNGYTIDGVESTLNENYKDPGDHSKGESPALTSSGGIFGYLGTGGIVRNVTFTNAVLRGLNGFICAYGDGLIENVVVSYKKIGGNIMTSGFGAGKDYRAMATFFSRGAGSNATVKNCIVDASMAEVAYETDGAECDVNLLGKAVNVIDSYVLSPDATLLASAGNAAKLNGYTQLANKVAVFENYDESIWKFVNGVPMLSGMASALEESVPAISFIGTPDTLIAGFEMYVRLDNPYVEVTIGEIAGTAYENGVLTATGEAKYQQVTLTAKSLIDPGVEAQYVVTIDWLGTKVDAPTDEVVKVLHTNPVIEIGDNAWLGTENEVYVGDKLVGGGTDSVKIDLDKYGWDYFDEDRTVTVVTMKDGEKSRFDVTLNVDYDENVIEKAEVVMNSFLVGDDDVAWRNLHKGVVLTEGEKPEGFDVVTQFNVKDGVYQDGKNIELTAANWDITDLREYQEVWFALKGTKMQTNTIPGYVQTAQEDWVFFHLTNTGTKGWKIEVKVGDKVFASVARQVDNESGHMQPEGSLMAILRGAFASCADGFAIRIDITGSDAIFYTTEVLGVKKN